MLPTKVNKHLNLSEITASLNDLFDTDQMGKIMRPTPIRPNTRSRLSITDAGNKATSSSRLLATLPVIDNGSSENVSMHGDSPQKNSSTNSSVEASPQHRMQMPISLPKQASALNATIHDENVSMNGDSPQKNSSTHSSSKASPSSRMPISTSLPTQTSALNATTQFNPEMASIMAPSRNTPLKRRHSLLYSQNNAESSLPTEPRKRTDSTIGSTPMKP